MEKEAKTSISEENKEERDDNLQRYELVYLISNKFSEDELEPITSAVIKLITDKSGKIINEENWGKRKLAYQIEHFYNAYYIIVEFESKSTEIPALENYLRLAEEILRHLIVKKRVKSEDEIKREKVAAQERDEQQAKHMQERAEQQKEGPRSPKSPAKPIKKETPKKVDIAELDKKLDKILDDTDSLL